MPPSSPSSATARLWHRRPDDSAPSVASPAAAIVSRGSPATERSVHVHRSTRRPRSQARPMPGRSRRSSPAPAHAMADLREPRPGPRRRGGHRARLVDLQARARPHAGRARRRGHRPRQCREQGRSRTRARPSARSATSCAPAPSGVIEEDAGNGIVKYGKPVGVVGAVCPSTNPAATPVNKAMMALKGGNAVIIAPSPAGYATTASTVELMRAELAKAGHPADLVQILPAPVTKEMTQALLEQVDLAVVTGSQNNVQARHAVRHGRDRRRRRQRPRHHRRDAPTSTTRRRRSRRRRSSTTPPPARPRTPSSSSTPSTRTPSPRSSAPAAGAARPTRRRASPRRFG